MYVQNSHNYTMWGPLKVVNTAFFGSCRITVKEAPLTIAQIFKYVLPLF